MILFKHHFKTPGTSAAILVAVLVGCGFAFGDARAQNSNKSDSIEIAELKAALATVQKQVDRERDRADEAEAKAKALISSLAEANRVREEQAKARKDLQLRMQAFGVDLLKVDGNSLEARMLKAVRELDLVRQSGKKLESEVTSLSEALFHCLQTIPESDAVTRELAETALTNANTALGMTAGPTILPVRKLDNGKVVSIDPEVGLIIVNVGVNSGARIGMPVEVVQKDQAIGTAMVVDVRGEICGAVLQEMIVSGVDVKVGDSIRPRPNEGVGTL